MGSERTNWYISKPNSRRLNPAVGCRCSACQIAFVSSFVKLSSFFYMPIDGLQVLRPVNLAVCMP
uniref:Uncharacterized protein n=1 Tax=Arundo donax TaxID=35708 RepID=A0A0A9HZW0_ARUDO